LKKFFFSHSKDKKKMFFSPLLRKIFPNLIFVNFLIFNENEFY